MADTCPKDTPWGRADFMQEDAPGIWFVSTPSHGGFWLSTERRAQMPAYMRKTWYEEDCEWSMVAAVFGDELRACSKFNPSEESVRDNFRGWHPDEYERFYGVTLADGESYIKDERIFREKHKQDWVVISASQNPDKTITVFAAKGGRNSQGNWDKATEKQFLVPAEEYRARSPHGFVIDPARHSEVSK